MRSKCVRDSHTEGSVADCKSVAPAATEFDPLESHFNI